MTDSRFDKALRIFASLIEVGIAAAMVANRSASGVILCCFYFPFTHAFNSSMPDSDFEPDTELETVIRRWLLRPLVVFVIVLELLNVATFVVNRSVIGLTFCSLYIYFSKTRGLIESF